MYIYVYRDFSLSLNHFTQKAKMFGRIENAVHDMDENWQEDLRSGQSAIRCEIDVPSDDWGGWLFLNGYLPAGETEPHLSDGLNPDQGIDLTGAAELRFYAKGEMGGEKVFLGAGASKYLSSEVCGGFTGNMIGIYASGSAKGIFEDFEIIYE